MLLKKKKKSKENLLLYLEISLFSKFSVDRPTENGLVTVTLKGISLELNHELLPNIQIIQTFYSRIYSHCPTPNSIL